MFARLVHSLTSPGLLRLAALAGVIGWVLAFFVHFSRLEGLTDRNGEPIGGDFASVYTAGRLVLEGRAAHLYDVRLQQETQGRLMRSPDYRALCLFVSPPGSAAVFAALALLPYKPAYLAYTALMAAAFLLAMRLLRPHVPALDAHWGAVVGLSFLFYPFAVTITGGQNTALTFLLMAAAYAYLRRGADGRAGLVLGLLFYKPQLALLLCLLLLPCRRYRCLLAAGAVAGSYYVVGALLCGVWWPLDMIAMFEAYWPIEHEFNGFKSISLIGFCEYALAPTLGKPVGMLLTACLVGGLLWLWRRADPRRDEFARYWGMAVCATLLVSPHTQWYDSGVVLLAVLLGLNNALVRGDRPGPGVRAALLAGFLLPPAYALSPHLGWQPLVLLPVVALFWLLRLPRARRPSRVAPAVPA